VNIPGNHPSEVGFARAGGSVHEWSVAQVYEIRHGTLSRDTSANYRLAERSARGEDVPNSEYEALSPKRYLPFAFPNLPIELSKLKPGDEEAVRKFAEFWGALGYGGFPNESGRTNLSAPEPLTWIWAHAETVSRVLKLIRLLRDSGNPDETEIDRRIATGKLSAFIDSIKEPDPPGGIEFDMQPFFNPALGYKNFFFRIARGTESIDYIHGYEHPDTPLDPPEVVGSYVAHETINANIREISPRVILEGGKPARSHSFPALISVIYWHLSNAAVGGIGYRTCAYCKSWFAAHSGKLEYCPPPPGKKGESTCAYNARAARKKAKKQEASVDG
jgi:hypothetical protein